MKIFLIVFLVVLAILELVIIGLAVYSGKPIKRLVINAILGLIVLAIIDLTTKYSGVKIPINIFSIVGITAFSLPAVIGFLLLQVLFFI